MKIKVIKPSNVKGYLSVGVLSEEGYLSFVISEGQYISLGSPLAGDTVSPESLSALSEFSSYNKAKKKALGILSYGDNSRGNLIMKLRRAGFSRELSERVADEMLSLGYINEERQLRRMIEREVNVNLSGARKLIPKMVAKGYSADTVRRVIAELADEEIISFDEVRRKLRASLPSDASYEEIKKILYKHGF